MPSLRCCSVWHAICKPFRRICLENGDKFAKPWHKSTLASQHDRFHDTFWLLKYRNRAYCYQIREDWFPFSRISFPSPPVSIFIFILLAADRFPTLSSLEVLRLFRFDYSAGWRPWQPRLKKKKVYSLDLGWIRFIIDGSSRQSRH